MFIYQRVTEFVLIGSYWPYILRLNSCKNSIRPQELETFPNKSERTGSKGYNELVVPALNWRSSRPRRGGYQVPLEGKRKGH